MGIVGCVECGDQWTVSGADMWDPYKYYNAQFTIIMISECCIDQLFSLKPTGVGNRVDKTDKT